MEDKLHYVLVTESGLLNRVPRSPLTNLAPHTPSPTTTTKPFH